MLEKSEGMLKILLGIPSFSPAFPVVNILKNIHFSEFGSEWLKPINLHLYIIGKSMAYSQVYIFKYIICGL